MEQILVTALKLVEMVEKVFVAKNYYYKNCFKEHFNLY